MTSITRPSGGGYPPHRLALGETFPIDALSSMPKYRGEEKAA
ncbi:MAG TPA: hypothetical protein VGQ34_09795 [Sphingomicrobium sp.]|jgi:hypothetical protein|nr:hypothetical protein [Sphingomicrobium sp.]